MASTRLRVASASGLGWVEVDDSLITAFLHLGMEMLGINHCTGSEFDNAKSLEFLRGGHPTWDLFHYHDSGQKCLWVLKDTFSVALISMKVPFALLREEKANHLAGLKPKTSLAVLQPLPNLF